MANPTASPAPSTPIRLTSFGYLHGPPPASTLIIDVRDALRDPHVDPNLRKQTGADEQVRWTVLRTPGAVGLISRLTLLTAGLAELRIPVTVAVGCAGGRHRSVVLATEIAARLRLSGWPACAEHRDLHRPVVHRPDREEF